MDASLLLPSSGDKYHYLLLCEQFKNARQTFIKPYVFNRPSVLKFQQLMNGSRMKDLRNLCHFNDTNYC